MNQLEIDFHTAVQRADSLRGGSRQPTNDQLLRLYALYKIATVGDFRGPMPGILDVRRRAMANSWREMVERYRTGTGIDQQLAMADYVDLVAEL